MSQNSFNGARRMSARNDENLAFDIDVDDKSLAVCENLASKLNNMEKLPKGCRKYASVVKTLEKKIADDQTTLNQAFAGMSPGQAQRAKTQRLQGRESQAQFQRRHTRSHKMSR